EAGHRYWVCSRIELQCQRRRRTQTRQDNLLLAAIEVGPADVPSTISGPVQLAASHIERDRFKSTRPSNEDLLVGAIQVGPPDRPGAAEAINPVHLTAAKVQDDASGVIQPTDEDFWVSRAVEVGPLDSPGAAEAVGPVHLAASRVEIEPAQITLPC